MTPSPFISNRFSVSIFSVILASREFVQELLTRGRIPWSNGSSTLASKSTEFVAVDLDASVDAP